MIEIPNTKFENICIIVDSNFKFACKLKEIIINQIYLQNIRKIIICNINQNGHYYEFFKLLFEAKQHKEKLILLINSELLLDELSKHSELNGLSLALRILTSMTLDFSGNIILYGFLPETILNKKLKAELSESLNNLKNLDYIQLPFSILTLKERINNIKQQQQNRS